MIKFQRRTDFYTRYDDGKREMSLAEIRRAFQADRMQLTIDSLSNRVDLIGQKIDEAILKQKSEVTAEAAPVPAEKEDMRGTAPFFPISFSDGQALVEAAYDRMMAEVKDKPYFWIAATPKVLDANMLDVDSDKIREVIRIAPGSRRAGWNMELSTADATNIPDGIERGAKDFEYLALYRNAHMEFWTPIGRHFCWTQKPEEFEREPELYPYAVVEYTVTFLRLYKAIVESSSLKSEFFVNLRYVNLKGHRLRPYAPKQFGYIFAEETKPFGHDHLTVPSLLIDQSFEPDATAYQLLIKVYGAFGLESTVT